MMATHPDFPGATSRLKNGKTVWRYRRDRNAKQIGLPGEPGDASFQAAYDAAVQGGKPARAAVVAMPGAARPQTFAAAFRLLQDTSEWNDLDPDTHRNKKRYTGYFLAEPAVPGYALTWGETPVSKMDFQQLDALLARVKKRDGGNIAKRWLENINGLIIVALRHQWINHHPGFGLKMKAPPTDGHRPWPREVREQFEAYWAIGTPARTAYELGLWLGNRRSDIVRLRWDQRVRAEWESEDGAVRIVEAFDFRQKKNAKRNGGREMFLPILPWLDAALLPNGKPTVLVSTRGTPYSDKVLTNRMQRWVAEAGIASWTDEAGRRQGYTLHGLRKSLGGHLAELGLSSRQIMEVLGHSNLGAAEVYVRNANKRQLTIDAFDAVEKAEARRRLRVVK